MILLDGQVSGDALLSDRGLNYGDGLFETIALRDGSLLSWEKHMERLRSGCAALGLSYPTPTQLLNEAHAVAEGRPRGIVKIILTRGGEGRGYRPPHTACTRRIVAWHDWPLELDGHEVAPVLTWVCQHRLGTNPQLAGIKHINRLEQVLASAEWPAPHYFEGLMQDFDGLLVEGTRSNLFLLRRGQLLTPDLTRCGIAGIVRAAVIDAAPRIGLNVQVCSIAMTSLTATDELFICNSVFGLRAVAQIDDGCNSLRLNTSGVVAALADQLRADNIIP
jgi:4-amino-4-deoxychorismate lyase